MRWLALAALLVLPVPAAAQGWIEPLPWPRPGRPPSPVERLRTSVTVRVTDRVATVEVEEWFRNTGHGLAEGDYIYPLAGEAVFSGFSLFQGEEELRGETLDADRARSIYEEIVRRHRDPALIELAGHGLLRARVFPFGPGETRNVRLRYTQVLERAGDALRFRYLAGAARRGGPRAETADETRGTHAPTPLTFTLVADNADRFTEPFSPTDRLQVARDRGRLTVRPAGTLAGSFDVFLPLAVPRVGISLATHRVNGEDGYFMITLSPGAVTARPEPRDVAVVVDTSGSMSGEKIEQARDALRQLLGTLNPTDRFRLVAFANQVTAHRPEWSPVTRASLDEARTWVDRLAANGGTNIGGALAEALRTPGGAGRLHVVVVITDGQPTVGEVSPDRIAANVEATRGAARIFTFGVGHDLDTYLLDRLAVAGRGTVDYVEPGRSVEEAVGALANRIRLPVLVDLALGGAPVRLTDLQPARLPDVFAGQDLVVFGRYAAGGAAAGELSLTGTRGGRAERHTARVEFPEHAASGDYLPSLWAARKVGELTRTIRLEGATPERIAEVRDLALRYGLLSDYTSHLVQEPTPGSVDSLSVRQPIGRGAGIGQGVAVLAPSPEAPSSMTGAPAVAAAKAASQLLEIRSRADVADVQHVRLASSGLAARADVRVVAGRRFQLDAGVWIDAGQGAQMEVIHLEPFSAAYFAALAHLPELKPYLQAFDAVTVAGREVSIRVAPGGRVALPAREVEALVRRFRAR